MMKKAIFLVLLAATALSVYAQPEKDIEIWPGEVPGKEKPKAAAVAKAHDDGVTRVSEVTNPLLEVFVPDGETTPKGAVIVFPGGGYNILAIDKEGYEVAEWFNKQGYMAFVLQYRVPRKREGALMDAQRAIRVVRENAGKFNIDPNKIGVLGFSAGGSLAARLSTRYQDVIYAPIDKTDSLSCRPDFSILIYPAYLDGGEDRSITPELKVTGDTPPMFLFVAADDRHANSSLVMTQALRDQEVPVELHILPKGGHGFGMRKGSVAGVTWPPLVTTWLNNYIIDDKH